MKEADLDLLVRKIGPDKVAHLLALGPTLRAVRGLLDITQEQLAASCGLSKRTIIKLEKGLCAVDWMTLAAVSRGLSIMGVETDIRSGRLQISLPAKAIDADLGKIAATHPKIIVFAAEQIWPY